MTNDDRKRFAKCLMGCAEVLGKTISEAAIAIWWSDLEAHDIDAVESAFARHRRSPDAGQFMPKPADIIRMLTGTSIDASMVAWAKVDKAVRAVGSYVSVTFDDALIQRVLQDMGGWIALGTKGDDEWPFIGNEFRTRYQGYRSRGEVPDYPPKLIGIVEADNTRGGFVRPKDGSHVLIGDTDKARLVASGGTMRPAIGLQRVGPQLEDVSAKVLALPDKEKRL